MQPGTLCDCVTVSCHLNYGGEKELPFCNTFHHTNLFSLFFTLIHDHFCTSEIYDIMQPHPFYHKNVCLYFRKSRRAFGVDATRKYLAITQHVGSLVTACF